MLKRAAIRKVIFSALVSGGLLGALPLVLAQETFQSGAMSRSTSESLGVSSQRPDEHGMLVGNWFVYPSFFLGYVFNDNIYGRPYNRIAASGLNIRPSIMALNENGLHNTMAYASADIQVYPGLGAGLRYDALQQIVDAPPTNIAGRVGVVHVWEPQKDWTIRASLDASRQNGLFTSYLGATNDLTFMPNAFSFSSVQQYINQISGLISVEKKIGERGFVRASASGFYTAYDNRPTFTAFSPFANIPAQGFGGDFQNGFGFRGSVRGGAWITPQIYAFVEPSIDLRRYPNSFYDTNGYRILAGLGSDMIGLFRGEIYGGYQSQSGVNGMFARTSAPAFGARLFYYPTRDLTFSLSVDQTLSSTSAPNRAFGVTPYSFFAGQQWASAARSTQVLGQAEYTVNSRLSAYLRGGWGQTTFNSPHFVTSAWSVGGGVNYQLWRNLSLNVDYQFMKTKLDMNPILRQNVVYTSGMAQGFSRNVVSVGLNWRF